MKDDNETHFLDVVPSLVNKIEELHERHSVNRMVSGRKPADFNIFYNAVILNGVATTAHRLDEIDNINDELVAAIRDGRE